MSQLSIGIGNKLGSYVGALGGAAESFIYNYGWTPYQYQTLNLYGQWDEVVGTNEVRYSANGEFYPQGTGYHRWITPEQPTDDCFFEFYCRNSWATSNDHLGVMVRGSTVQNSGYSFYVGDLGRVLSRWDNNVETVLDSDATAPVTGDKYELRAIGSTISVIFNDVELFSKVDATYSSGWFGMVSRGLDANAVIADLHAGPYPKGNATWFQGVIGSGTRNLAVSVVDGCFTSGDIDNANDTSGSSTTSHTASPHDVGGVNMHWMQWDMLVPCYTTGIVGYDHTTYHATRHWTSVSVFGRNDAGDDWTSIKANFDMSLPLTFGWLDKVYWDSPVTYRYYRLEVYTTEDASDQITAQEVAFIGDDTGDV